MMHHNIYASLNKTFLFGKMADYNEMNKHNNIPGEYIICALKRNKGRGKTEVKEAHILDRIVGKSSSRWW